MRFGSGDFATSITRIVRLVPGNNTLELTAPTPLLGVQVNWVITEDSDLYDIESNADIQRFSKKLAAMHEKLDGLTLQGTDGASIRGRRLKSDWSSFFAVPCPGRYSLTFPDDPLFTGLQPIEFEVPAKTVVEKELKIHP